MEIERINNYQDSRFLQKVLYQHGCFLVNDFPYEVEIISDFEAVIRGADQAVYLTVIDEFRFYAPHITCFYNENRCVVKEFPPMQLYNIELKQLQPSQFYVDEDKIAAVSNFIHNADDIIIQVLPYGNRYISLDGHTRLYYAVTKGWKTVRAVLETADDYIYDFVKEAKKRNIYTPYDLILVNHNEYTIKWHQFCDGYFAERRAKENLN